MRKSVVVLTGSELRHRFMRKAIGLCPDVEVVRSYCEGLTGSISDLVSRRTDESALSRRHLAARERSEQDFFAEFDALVPDRSNPLEIERGSINAAQHQEDIIKQGPDLLAAYGCSLIRGPLLERFSGRFLNVHLGLSPYYRGSGTNLWALINGEPEFVGATFMHIDAGIDTGKIIHQIRARIYPGDTPHQIGNRLIADIPRVYAAIMRNFDQLPQMRELAAPQNVRLYRQKDFTEEAVQGLYRRFENGLVEQYLERREERERAAPIVVNPGVHAQMGAA